MRNNLKCITIGLLAGLANGLFGSGGGLFLVPLFIGWLKMEQRKSFATSIAVILPLSIVSAVIYFIRGNLDILGIIPFFAGGLTGGFLSGRLFKKVPINILRKVFGVLIIYGGIRATFNI